MTISSLCILLIKLQMKLMLRVYKLQKLQSTFQTNQYARNRDVCNLAHTQAIKELTNISNLSSQLFV